MTAPTTYPGPADRLHRLAGLVRVTRHYAELSDLSGEDVHADDLASALAVLADEIERVAEEIDDAAPTPRVIAETAGA